MADNPFADLIPAQQDPFADLIPGENKPSVMGDIGRQLGLTARALAGGAAQAVEPFTEPVRYGLNAILPGNPVGGLEEATDAALTKMGVPGPENAIERGVQTAGRFVTSLAGGAGEAAVANRLAGVKPRLPDAPVPTTDELAERAAAAYKAAEDTGVVYRPESVLRLGTQMAARLKNEGIDPSLHPKATAALKRITESGEEGLSIKDLDTLRKIAKDAASSNDAGERRLSKIMTNMMDDFVQSARAGDAISGDTKEAARQITQARDLWARKSKAEIIEGLFDVADINQSTFSQSGFENALRTKFRQLARNSKEMRKFSSEEQEAIKLVAKGGPMDNALRMIGKMAPRGVVSGILAPGAVMSTLGPVPAAAMAMTGEAARRGATKATVRNAEKAHELMRRGGQIAPQQGIAPIPPWMLPAVIGLDDPAYE